MPARKLYMACWQDCLLHHSCTRRSLVVCKFRADAAAVPLPCRNGSPMLLNRTTGSLSHGCSNLHLRMRHYHNHMHTMAQTMNKHIVCLGAVFMQEGIGCTTELQKHKQNSLVTISTSAGLEEESAWNFANRRLSTSRSLLFRLL